MTSRIIKLRKAHHYCDLYELTREERISLTQMVLRRDITSWKDLDEDQLGRMLDCLEGFGLISHLMSERQPYTSTTA